MSAVSIIIPCYNHTGALKKSLQTLRNQSLRPSEVIIVDDGSDVPVTTQMLGPAARDLPLRIIRQDNAGAPAARNTGFAASTSAYVIFWDADILAKPSMLAEMAVVLDTHPEIGFVYSDFYFGKKLMKAQPFSLASLQERNYIHSTTLVRKTDVVKWDETLKRFQDWDFWLTLAEKGIRGHYIKTPLCTAIPHRGGMSGWLPAFAYQSPWKCLPGLASKVRAYETARSIVQKKHGIQT